jgi:uroporphyrinogen decarboxylase
MNSREIVYKTLNFDNPERVPRQLWVLPWAENNYPEKLGIIKRDYPDDIITAPGFNKVLPLTQGDPYEIGMYIDDWGCKFTSIQKGVIGEIKDPLIRGEEYEDIDALRVPIENLSINIDRINDFCLNTDKFVMAGACPRPFEQLQFIRGTEQLYVDLMLRPEGLTKVIDLMHVYYCELLTVWAQTEVDALMFMDDWGSQRSLLIDPKLWGEIFKPLYKDYIDIAHKYNKKIFMHSDGYILDIIPELIEMGLDAVNSQIFCMGVENLIKFKGKITFWGEIDRQNILPHGSLDDIRNAVKSVKENLWEKGGCIAQCEFGPGGNPDNVYEVYKTWNGILKE